MLKVAHISKGLLRLAVSDEQAQLVAQMSAITDRLASGKVPPQQLGQLSSKLATLSKRFFCFSCFGT